MNESKKRGNLTELQCITAFVELGYNISIPFGEDSRYDFIADINDKLYKIQCKSSSEILDKQKVIAIHFKTVRQTGNCSKKYIRTKYQTNEIDYFATSYKGKCYLISVKECSNEKTLRIEIPKNNQTKGITFLKDCELNEVINQL